MERAYIYSQKFDVYAIVAKDDAAQFRPLGFSLSDKFVRKSDLCGTVFKGTKDKYVRCIIDSKDAEQFIRIGFVANVERLSDKKPVRDDDSQDNSRRRAKALQRVERDTPN